MPHRRNKDEKVMPEVHLDFMFFGPKDSPGDTVPCLVMREVVSNMVMRLGERWRQVHRGGESSGIEWVQW